MKVILLERIARLGQMGDTVTVRDGFARNYLLPQQKAMRATADNMKRFEGQRAQLEARNLELKQEASAVAAKLEGQSFIVIRQAGDTGQLYGSVATRDIAEVVCEGGYSINRNQVQLDRPIKALGVHDLKIRLHPEVEAAIRINVARSPEEAERQARGEDVSVIQDDLADIFAEGGEDLFEEGAEPGEEPGGDEAAS
ncbi:MAG: 50S ribosomal protein L9 [Rhizobiales bacterium]|nr:50S ribosomal protein L9 [Hyphomicrobiales bacterium]